MGFNYKKEFAMFQAAFEADKSVMLAAGMSEEDIQALYARDLAEFNSNRRFYRYQDEHADVNDDEWLNKSTAHLKKPDVESVVFSGRSLAEAERKEVLDALPCLNDGERAVMSLYCEKDMPLTAIAEKLKLPYDTIQKRRKRALEKISNKF
ncbi:MAG: hypothetical protein LBQ48_06610 [Oscillospiraceae bacterium]|nr:hypothetical protein [Oscillospiraceae bacterium]